jgi:uncharacterized protein
MKIFGINVEKGQKIYHNIKVGELANFSDFYIPVLIARGMQDGPTLWMTGAVHGDELNGPWALREFFHELDTQKLCGNIVITPLLNVLAFVEKNKISHIDDLDLDQQFPGKMDGSYTQRIAYMVFQEMKKWATWVIDFHTMGHAFSSTPYTVSKNVPGVKLQVIDQAFKLARLFGVYPNCHLDLATATGELPGTTNGSIDITCLQHNIPCFMAEMGAGGRWDEEAIRIIRQGIDNVLKYTKMLPGAYKKPGKQMIITNRCFLRCNCGGFVRMATIPGKIVKQGETLAVLCDFQSERERMVADVDLFMIAVRHEPVVTTGDRMGFVGCQWHEEEWQE